MTKHKHSLEKKHIATIIVALLLLILLLAMLFTPLGSMFSSWLKLQLASWLGLDLSGNGDGDGNGNGNNTGSFYITLSITPLTSDRQNSQYYQITISTNVNQTKDPMYLQYRYKGESIWHTRTKTSPENDFFAGYYQWRIWTVSGVTSNIVETTTNGLSLWLNGMMEGTAVGTGQGDYCYAEDGSTYKNWVIFYWIYDPAFNHWNLAGYSITDSVGKIFGIANGQNAPAISGTFPVKATLSTRDSFADCYDPDPETFEENLYASQHTWMDVPDPNMNSGLQWYIESNVIQLTIT